ncbi:hypothetical protein [Soonwooa sp.]|uniref:hypothetical protein n=1 Tax=Soonwooa sp. TaxID=1938592 RepID=UPI0028A685DB|nr:hypothetical protein [Soonwooa sp.]
MSEELLLNWYSISINAEKGITTGQFRAGTEPMQVASGEYGDFTIHYEALPSKDLQNLIPD